MIEKKSMSTSKLLFGLVITLLFYSTGLWLAVTGASGLFMGSPNSVPRHINWHCYDCHARYTVSDIPNHCQRCGCEYDKRTMLIKRRP